MVLEGLIGAVDFNKLKEKGVINVQYCGCDGYDPDHCGTECQPDCRCDNDYGCTCYEYCPDDWGCRCDNECNCDDYDCSSD